MGGGCYGLPKPMNGSVPTSVGGIVSVSWLKRVTYITCSSNCVEKFIS